MSDGDSKFPQSGINRIVQDDTIIDMMKESGDAAPIDDQKDPLKEYVDIMINKTFNYLIELIIWTKSFNNYLFSCFVDWS